MYLYHRDVVAGGKKGGKGQKSASSSGDGEDDGTESLDDIAGIPESKARFDKVLQVCPRLGFGIVAAGSTPGGRSVCVRRIGLWAEARRRSLIVEADGRVPYKYVCRGTDVGTARLCA